MWLVTLHNVCAVHRGMFGTLGDIIEYTEGCSVYHEYTGGVQYSGGTMSTVGIP